ncbi:hypothetical protein [Saccharospirillum salsuginis]|uniref:DUF3828 domain-containing protein n=1 Tax=Saccharospirillum salsuginis TaxID=418750 RepID=A0A918K8G3_9GAMM|nr:hypothetical protein [Saccharospirillum salsuginis]GGX54539.1 hypothetical protein GCM10007392_22420 [Saccharospirillum salsuginis]
MHTKTDKVMKRMILPLSIFLSACASTAVDETGQVSLYQEFQRFGSLIVEDEILATETMVSAKYVARIKTAQKNMPEALRSPYYRDLATKLRTEYSHYEDVQSGQGCLTINGLDDRQRPKSLSLYYVSEGGRWVIDSIMVALHQSIDDYYREATCPAIDQ